MYVKGRCWTSDFISTFLSTVTSIWHLNLCIIHYHRFNWTGSLILSLCFTVNKVTIRKVFKLFYRDPKLAFYQAKPKNYVQPRPDESSNNNQQNFGRRLLFWLLFFNCCVWFRKSIIFKTETFKFFKYCSISVNMKIW